MVGILRHALLGLHRLRGDGELAGRRRALYRKLVDLPLLELVTGRLISLRTAERERPVELAHLGLWDVPPEPVAPEPAKTQSRARPAPVPDPERRAARAAPAPEQRLLEAVREELRLVRLANQTLLSDAHLDRLRMGADVGTIAEIRDGCVVIDAGHVLVTRAIAGEDPVLVSFLASIAYTSLNVLAPEISDEHEALFHELHAAHVLEGMLARAVSGEQQVAEDEAVALDDLADP
jgi:hypothetical protein